MRSLCRLSLLAFAVVVTVAVPTATAQETIIRPGSDEINATTITPFHAEYEQVGTPFWLDLRRTEGTRPTFSAVMTMHSFQGGLAVDHAGFYGDNLEFAYRKTTFGRWGLEYLDVAKLDGEVRMARMSLDPDGYDERRFVSAPADPVFEGTLMYWLLAALPLGQLETFSVPTLSWTETGFQETATEFSVVGREQIAVDGVAYDCVIVAASNAQFELRSYVAHRAPYLIRQIAIQGDTEQTVIELKHVEAAEQ